MPPPVPTEETETKEIEPNDNDLPDVETAHEVDSPQKEDLPSIQEDDEIEILEGDLPAIEALDTVANDPGTLDVESPIESSQNPIQKVVFPSWSNAFTRIFNP